MQLILASTSPRRRELLALLGIPFEIIAPDFEELPQPGLLPRQQVEHFAREKAGSIAIMRPASLVLGSLNLLPSPVADRIGDIPRFLGLNLFDPRAVVLTDENFAIVDLHAANRFQPFQSARGAGEIEPFSPGSGE